MNKARMNVEKMVDVLRATGWGDNDMHRFHQHFERRYPQEHEAFLKWLNLPEAEVQRIREWSRT